MTPQDQQAVIRHYDALIDEGNDPVQDPAPLRRYMDGWDGAPFLGALALSGEETVLEIGVGTGRLAVKIAPQCKAFYGIDLSPKTVGRAKEHLAGFPHVHLLWGDFLTYPFDRQFDVICSSLTFLHIKEKQAALSKVAALLTEGGRFVLSIDKNRSTVLSCGERELTVYPDTPEQIAALAAAEGLSVRSQEENERAYIFMMKKGGNAG